MFYKGKLLRLTFGDKKVLHAMNCEITIDSKLEEIATKDTNGTVVIPDGYTVSGSTEALLSKLPVGNTTHITPDTLIDSQIAEEEIDIAFSTSVTGDIIYTTKGYIKNSKITAETGSSVKVSISFSGTGDLVKDVVA